MASAGWRGTPICRAKQIIDDWTRLTFGTDSKVVDTVNDIQLKSWRVYENYTGPLGLRRSPTSSATTTARRSESSERNGWGQWHRADENGVGMDRTVARPAPDSSGSIGRRSPRSTSRSTCPDDLVLFMHHVPYTHRLKSGKTVIQHIYDSHYDGARRRRGSSSEWRTLKGHIDEQRYQRSARPTGVPGRPRPGVARRDLPLVPEASPASPTSRAASATIPNRIEAEDQELDGYGATNITPWEAASGREAAQLPGDDLEASQSGQV